MRTLAVKCSSPRVEIQVGGSGRVGVSAQRGKQVGEALVADHLGKQGLLQCLMLQRIDCEQLELKDLGAAAFFGES